MRKRTASGKAHPVGGNHFGVFPWVFVSLRRSFTHKKNRKTIVFSGFVVLFLLFAEYAKALQRF